MFDIGCIIFVSFVLLSSVAIYGWGWRGRFLLGKPTGFRLEEHRRQWSHSFRSTFPALGVLTLLAADRVLDLCHVSRVLHAFWTGAIIASYFWLVAILIYNCVAQYRQIHAGRQGRRDVNMDMAGMG